jgi:hypothetical protein
MAFVNKKSFFLYSCCKTQQKISQRSCAFLLGAYILIDIIEITPSTIVEIEDTTDSKRQTRT